MNMGFVKPSYPNEKRVALLPEHIEKCFDDVVIEDGYGEALGISNIFYEKAGAVICSRDEIFRICDFIYSLKLLQPSDYHYLRNEQTIIGWTHPTGSGATFFNTVCQEKNLKIVDLDSQSPRLYYQNYVVDLDIPPKGFINANSRLAGFASVQHALMMHGSILGHSQKVAVLAVGNVAQGALSFLQKFTSNLDIYTRTTIKSFLDNIHTYDIIVNGAEVDSGHIINATDKLRIKSGALVIDAAADGNGAIEGTRYTTIEHPIYLENGVYYYVVNNSPSIIYRESSKVISSAFAQHIYPINPEHFILPIKRYTAAP